MKPTITIGIPALNEEANIKNLLISLLEQKGDFELEKIIVVSDGSSDNTVAYAKSVHDPRIVVIDGDTRKGKAIRQNEMCDMAESDVLVILDADILPANKMFLSELIFPIISDPLVGLTSGPYKSVNPKNFFEKILAWGVYFKEDLFESMQTDNIFLCVGADRAFSKSFYKKIHWPGGYPEDLYSYLNAITMGYKFKYQKSAQTVFRVPDNFKDHLKQSRRFINSENMLRKYFSEELVFQQCKIPKDILISKMVKYFFKNPVYATSYALICLYPRIFKKSNTMLEKWDMSKSTKKLA